MSDNNVPAAFIFGEVELAEASGIHVSQFAGARKKLRQAEHWDLNNMRVAYSQAGLTAVLEAVLPVQPAPELLQVLTEQALLDQPEKTAAAAQPAKEIDGTVTRIGGHGGPWANAQLMELKLPDDTLVRIRVRETKNFRRGMKCPLRWNQTTNTYELARRLPRFPGKW